MASGLLLPDTSSACNRGRLVCFPHAGGGQAPFYRWKNRLPAQVELLALRLPGREQRYHDPPYHRLEDLARDAAEELAPLSDAPYALLGYSLGALAALETARELRRRGANPPTLLIPVASAAPQALPRDAPLCHLADEQFIAEVRRRYDGIPEAILSDPQLLSLFLPALRSDLQMVESYQYRPEEPLNVEILAMGGADDAGVPVAALQAWRVQTSGRFKMRLFPGGHFFMFPQKQDLSSPIAPLSTIMARLRALWRLEP